MHTIGAAETSFDITIDGQTATLDDLLPGHGDTDRLGLVVRTALGGLGASALVLAAVTDFYARHADDVRALEPGELLYPEHYVLHIGQASGDYAWLDFWPPDKETVVADEPDAIAQAVLDHGITRLLIEDPQGAPIDRALDTGLGRLLERQVRTSIAFSPTGRTSDADVGVTSNSSAETWVEWTIDPERGVAESGRPNAASVARSARSTTITDAERDHMREVRRNLRVDGRPVETYRRMTVPSALRALVGGRTTS